MTTALELPLFGLNDQPTSITAAPSVGACRSLRERVLDAHRHRQGLTDDELVQLLPDAYGPTVVSLRARMSKAGDLVDSGERRMTRQQREAIVWVLP